MAIGRHGVAGGVVGNRFYTISGDVQSSGTGVMYRRRPRMHSSFQNRHAKTFVAVTDTVFPNLDAAREVVAKVDAELILAKAPTPEGIVEAAKDADAILTTYAK